MQLVQKHEARSDTQPVQKQGNGAKLASPRGSNIAQLEALAASSPRLAAQGAMAAQLAASPAMAAQSARMGAIRDSSRSAFQLKQVNDGADAVQLVEEEEPMQGKFEPAQLVEEEEPMQGKFEPAQLVEEEEPLQGKFEPAQLVEEEEPMQGKFEPAQLVEEEEPMQGKFETAQLADEEEEGPADEAPAQAKRDTAQLESEEEEGAAEEAPAQAKRDAAQFAAEEEEPVQGKFEPAQLESEEEEGAAEAAPAQAKRDTAQLAAEEEEPLQGKFEPAQLVEEEEPLQGKAAGGAVAQREEASAPNKTGMPDQLKSGIENMSGMSMDHVKVHYNSPEPAQLNAHAFAQGSDIHVAPGQEQHLPHEAWHVVQQAQGRVQPTKQMKRGTPVNDDKGLETEADVMGAKAMETGKQVQQQAQLKEIEATSTIAQLEGRARSGSVSGSAPGPSEVTAPSDMQTEEWTDFDDSLPEQAEEEDSELQVAESATPAEKSTLKRMGPGLKVGVTAAKDVAGGINGVAESIEKVANPIEKGSELFASSNSVFDHIKDAAVGVVGTLISPVVAIINAGLGMKTKWAQWNLFDETTTEVVDGKKVAKADAPPEAVYALTKSPAGFMKQVSEMFWGVVDFTAKLAALIPGGQFVTAALGVFKAVGSLLGTLYKSGKKIYQFFRGEKKKENASSLLEKAINNDPAALTLLLRLKLPSVCGTGFGLADEIMAWLNEAKSTVAGKVTGDKSQAKRIIDLMKPGGGGPTSEAELHRMILLIKNHKASKDILLKDIEVTMTGVGT